MKEATSEATMPINLKVVPRKAIKVKKKKKSAKE